MADPITQVMTPSPSDVATAQVMNDQATVASYLTTLTNARSLRVGFSNQITALASSINNLNDQIQTNVSQFMTDALGMFPELQGMDMDQVMAQVPTDSPLAQLWAGYQTKIDALNNQIGAALDQADLINQMDAVQAQIEQNALSDYATFAAQATTSVPTPDQLQSQLATLTVIPTVQDQGYASVLTMPALENFSPAAANMVTKQIADQMTQDSSVIVDASAGTQAATQAAADAGVPVVPPSLKPIGIVLALLAMAYIFSGSSKESAVG